jgi:hypothetical protein
MLANIGFKYNHAAKKWLAAFVFAACPTAMANAYENGKTMPSDDVHHELLTLEEIERREQESYNAGKLQDYAVYDLAADAIRDTVSGLRAAPYDLPPYFEDRLYSVDQTGEKFKVIDPVKDVDWTEYELAYKTAYVKAEHVPPGTIVETVMADGHVETTKTAGPEGGYRVTNPDGEQYLVDTKEFEQKYTAAEEPGVYIPNSEPRKVVSGSQNVAFTAPWGEEMRIKEDGVLVHNGPGDGYGIQGDEFKNTYKPA